MDSKNSAETRHQPVSPKRLPRRLLLLGAFGLLAIGATALYAHYRYSRPVGLGPAGPTVARTPFQTVWSERKVVLLGLGDSVTQGLGASPGQDYFRRLVKNPVEEFPDMQGICLSQVLPQLEALNLSIAGTTSIECVDYQLPKLTQADEQTFGIVVITTGGNDVIHNYGRTPPREGAMFGATADQIEEWVANFELRLNTIAERIRWMFPGGSHIFIANIYDPTDGDGDIQHAGLPPWADGLAVLAAYNRVLSHFAENNPDVTLVEMREEFLGHGIHCTHFWHRHYRREDPYYWYWDNLEDPNDRGYDAIRRLFLNEMARLLPKKLNQ